MKIFANTIVNNEENFIWFSIMSVVDFVDKILVWDSGSTDKTVEIIKEIIKIKPNKIDFKEVGRVDKYQFPKMRQAMLEQSDCDWILILDGDEIWWNESINKLVNEIKIKKDEIEGIVVPMVVPAGDIFHFQEEAAGRYNLLGQKGHLSLRAINKKIEGLHVDWPYGKESFLDKNNIPVQERKNIIFLSAPFLHATHLRRSGKKRRSDKFKYELGKLFPKNFKYPEILNASYPKIISSPWIKISGTSKIVSKILTPLRKIKRRLL